MEVSRLKDAYDDTFTLLGSRPGRWGSSALEGSPSRRRKLRFQTSIALWLYPRIEKASGINLEAKSGAGVPEAVPVVLATPATSLEPVALLLAFPLDYFSDVERGVLLLG